MTNKAWKRVGKLVLGLLLFCTVALAAKSASATEGTNEGYVCDVYYFPGASLMGNSGYIQLDLYSSAACSGSFLGTYYLVTSGNSYGVTPVFSEPALLANLRTLSEYANNGKHAYIGAGGTPNWAVTFVSYISF